MAGINAILSSAFQNRMGRDQSALIQNADHVRQLMHLDDAPSAIGNAIVIAADRDQAVMADPAFQLQERIEGRRGQTLKIEVSLRSGPPCRVSVDDDNCPYGQR